MSESNELPPLLPHVPERIIFCIDLHEEIDSEFNRQRGKKFSRLDHLKICLRLFAYTKSKMSQKHEFAICCLTTNTIWYQDFTNDLDLLSTKLQRLDSQGKHNSFDLSSVFKVISEKCPEILSTQEKPGVLPEFIYRAIFIYSRSATFPTLNSPDELLKQMFDAPYFYFDTLYLHSKPDKNTKPQEIYDFLTEHLERDEKISYVFENSTNTKRFFLNFGQLLAHPLQRGELSPPTNLNEKK
eukprot:TRINITY_DN15596_c0_g1_i1.p1 TRINITY_DN15596_c0_g1~~TRINITY_DN15596_c0_g1_i1.p1  ORF type:complete len:241 (-),score=29.38 TRINITY_DN15596_c0_g1_i1:19-741(-)